MSRIDVPKEGFVVGQKIRNNELALYAFAGEPEVFSSYADADSVAQDLAPARGSNAWRVYRMKITAVKPRKKIYKKAVFEKELELKQRLPSDFSVANVIKKYNVTVEYDGKFHLKISSKTEKAIKKFEKDLKFLRYI